MLIILGNNGYNTLGCIRCCGIKKLPFFLILVTDTLWNPVLKSKYLKDYYVVKTIEDGLKLLVDKCEFWKNSVLLPTSDKAESLLDEEYENLSQYYTFPHANAAGAVNDLMRKEKQANMAKEQGIAIPQTIFYHIGDTLPVDIKYPCIIKQERSVSGHKSIMNICKTHEDLQIELAKTNDTKDVLIQQYIEKEYELLLIGCRLANGEVWIPGVFKKERWYQSGDDASFGIISTDVESFFPNVKDVKALITQMNYYGPFSVEFGVMEGVPYFYEVNLRNDGTSHYFHKAGVFVPYIYYLSNTSGLDGSKLKVDSISFLFIDEFGDIRNIGNGISMRQWLLDIHKAVSYKYFDSHDVAPFMAFAPRRLLASIYKKVMNR